MHRTTILLDLDDTLIDTKALRRDLFVVFEELGYDQDHILATYREAYESPGHYHPLKHSALLNPDNDEDSTEAFLEKWNTFLTKLPKYVFPTTLPFLTSLDRELYSPQVCSWGNYEYQHIKAEHTGILTLVDVLHVPQGKKSEYLIENKVLTPDEVFIFVDNSETCRTDIAATFPQACIAETLTEARKFL